MQKSPEPNENQHKKKRKRRTGQSGNQTAMKSYLIDHDFLLDYVPVGKLQLSNLSVAHKKLPSLAESPYQW